MGIRAAAEEGRGSGGIIRGAWGVIAACIGLRSMAARRSRIEKSEAVACFAP